MSDLFIGLVVGAVLGFIIGVSGVIWLIVKSQYVKLPW